MCKNHVWKQSQHSPSLPKPPRVQQKRLRSKSHSLLHIPQTTPKRSHTQHKSSSSPFHSTPRQRSHTPRQRSHTPRQRSHTPRQRSHTPRQRSHTPRQRSHTPRQRSHTPRQRSHTPRQRSHTPRQRSHTPRQRSHTPRQRSHTPRQRSHTPRQRSHTPRQRSHTPRQRSYTPRQRSHTPRQRSHTPRQRSRSPHHSSTHQHSQSTHQWSHTPHRGNQHKEGGEPFPLDNGKFQRRVLYLLADIREKLSQVGQNCEPPDSQFHLVKMNSRRELKNLEGQLADKGKKNLMMSQLVKIGGADLEDCVKNMMKRVLTNKLMAMMNMDGTGPKKAFGKTRLCQVIIGAVQQSKPASSEVDIKNHMKNYLRSAPDRYGGMGRQKDQTAVDLCSGSE
ncbi:uncharacterized protein C2orf16-like [Osmerus eperlanus]|uniref:uncharacterized protein C2orf16-like n=1 Tax=Osmerus eperlanus TaxID=29151 RepID=UPI002E129323